jgi:tetrahydromethanopterin S-methyltransferase subunit G
MAEKTTRGQKLNDEQKTETRAAVAAYKSGHPQATLKEVREHLDLPYKDLITEGVLRGLAERRPAGSAGRGRTGRAATAATTGRAGRAGAKAGGKSGRTRTLERVIGDLNGLRKRRDDLDAEIEQLESEVRERMHQQLGPDHAGRIFGGLLNRLGDTAQAVGSKVGDTAQAVGSKVGDTVEGVTQRVSGNGEAGK